MDISLGIRFSPALGRLRCAIPKVRSRSDAEAVFCSALVRPEGAGLSASIIKPAQGHAGQEVLGYLWAEGTYSGLRAEDERLCALVMIGVNERGEKHFLAIEVGVRESKQRWRPRLLGCAR